MCGGDGQACTETLFFDPSMVASGVASAVLCAVASGVAPAVPLSGDFAQSENVRLEVFVIRCGGRKGLNSLNTRQSEGLHR